MINVVVPSLSQVLSDEATRSTGSGWTTADITMQSWRPCWHTPATSPPWWLHKTTTNLVQNQQRVPTSMPAIHKVAVTATKMSLFKGDNHPFPIINYVIFISKRLWMKISTILLPSVESRTRPWPHTAWCHIMCKKGNAHECSHPLQWRCDIPA